MDTCIFCKIAQKEISSKFVYEDENFVVFPDLHPQARVHWLIIPKKHTENILGWSQTQEGQDLAAALMRILPLLVAQAGIAETGFRLLTNCGIDAGQTVPHLHFHLMGGETLPC